jgi:hypothetical protein
MSIGTVLLLSIAVSEFCRLPALMVLVPVGRKIFSVFSAFFRVFVDVLDIRDDFLRFAGEILWFPILKTHVFLIKIQKFCSLCGKNSYQLKERRENPSEAMGTTKNCDKKNSRKEVVKKILKKMLILGDGKIGDDKTTMESFV